MKVTRETLIAGLLALAIGFALGLMPAPARAQSGCSIFVQGKIPTPGQWNQCLQTKQDALGYVPLNINGGSLTGRLATTASTTFRSGFSIAPGVAPTSPVNGDMWVTSTGLFAQINGSTVGPFSSSGSTVPSVLQGDLLYGSAATVISTLAKNTTATRYLSNTGTSNNPAWAQVNLANGVTGLLPLANITTGTQDTILGYFGSTSLSAGAVNNCTGALTYSTSSHAFGCNSTGAVTATGTPVANQVAQWTNATTLKGTNVVSLLAAGGGISLTGTTTATIALANNGSTINVSAGSTATISTTAVMAGFGSTCTITPGFSPRVRFTIRGSVFNNTIAQGGQLQGFYGTGTAPSGGATQTGTAFMPLSFSFQSAQASQVMPFTADGIATGLTPGVPYWFDLAYEATSNTAGLSSVSCTAQEF